MRRTICRAVAATAAAMALSIGMGGIANADSGLGDDLVEAHLDDDAVSVVVNSPASPPDLSG